MARYSATFRKYVKQQIDITKNFYTMKHRKLAEIQAFMMSTEGVALSKQGTQEAASHDSFKTTQIYLGKEDQKRMNELLSRLNSEI